MKEYIGTDQNGYVDLLSSDNFENAVEVDIPSDFIYRYMDCYKYEGGALCFDYQKRDLRVSDEARFVDGLEKTARARQRLESLQLEKLAREAEADDVITLAPLLGAWHEGKYEEGEVVNVNGVPYRCLKSHDSAEHPETAKRLWSAIHAKSAETALPYTHERYKKGEYMVFEDGGVYRCVADGADKPPDAAPALWEIA